MHRSERIMQIKDILLDQGKVFVEDLCSRFEVSEVTIRKDLNLLEEEGYVQRIYGGAIMTSENTDSIFLPRSMIKNEILNFSSDKRYIASIASRLVSDGDNIFIGCGDTCAAIAQAMLSRKANFVTNSILVAAILALNPSASVLVTGGNLSGYDRHFLSGDTFIKSMQDFHFKYAFLGAAGADISGGFTTYSNFEQTVCETVRKASGTVVFALASHKFGKTNFMKICDLTVADIIITDSDIPAEYRTYFAAHNIDVFVQ